VAAELGSLGLPPQAAARARDVQAILCRSYALASLGRHAAEGADLCATTHCQVYRPAPATAIGRLCREAADRTAGRVLWMGGRPVAPVYHADCGGKTSAASDVWGGPPSPYLVSVKDDDCRKRAPWRVEVALDRLAGALRQSGASDVGRLRDVQVARRDSGGRAAEVRLVGDEVRVVRGNDLRAAVTAALGASALRSTLFSVARRGDSPSSILSHYFPGTAVGVIRVGQASPPADTD